ncbi:hypothetical protein [Streptomyces thermolilacinus]|uniref:hypothetical protein n=1 Tax=Streptomyces thermolilacinus TaxID=285540 RepID=UPI0033CD8184
MTGPTPPDRRLLDQMTDDDLDRLNDRLDYLSGYVSTLETYAAEQRERAQDAEQALTTAVRQRKAAEDRARAAEARLAKSEQGRRNLRGLLDHHRGMGFLGILKATRNRLDRALRACARYRAELAGLEKTARALGALHRVAEADLKARDARVAELEQQAAIDTKILEKADADWDEARDVVQKYRQHAEQWQRWGEQHRDRATRYRDRLIEARRRAIRYRLAWRSARQRAAVLSAEVTRRAPLLGEYAVSYHAASQRVAELEQALAAEWDVSRRLLNQRQEMAAERYAWQERGDRAEAAIDRVRATVDDLCREPHPEHDHVCPGDVRRYVLAALDEPTQQDTDT